MKGYCWIVTEKLNKHKSPLDYPRKTIKIGEHCETGRPGRSDLKQYNQLQNTKSSATAPQKEGSNPELRRFSVFPFMFILCFSDGPTVTFHTYITLTSYIKSLIW